MHTGGSDTGDDDGGSGCGIHVYELTKKGKTNPDFSHLHEGY